MNTIGTESLLQKMQEMASVAKRESIDPGENVSENNFSSMFKDAVGSVNELQKDAAALKKSYELGDPTVNLTQVMIASQKSEISFQALLQVRNKLLSAYQEIMRMQI